MKTSTEIARLAVEGMSASEAEAFLKWLQKQVPQKVEANTPTLESKELWWLAKLKSGNVLPDVGWPTMLPVDDLGRDYIAAMDHDITTRGNVSAMGRFLLKVGAVEKLKPTCKMGRGRRGRCYVIHGLDECRNKFEVLFGNQGFGDDAQGAAPEADSGE